MARDTMFRNSQFQAEQAAQGREYTYRGLTGIVPGALASAGAVQDMRLRERDAAMRQQQLDRGFQLQRENLDMDRERLQIEQQGAVMDQALGEARLQQIGMQAQLYQQELGIRGMAAQTRMAELQVALVEAQTKQQLQELQQEKTRMEFPVFRRNDQWMGYVPGSRDPVELDEQDPRVADILLGQTEKAASAQLDLARAANFGANDPASLAAQNNRRYEAITRRIADIDKALESPIHPTHPMFEAQRAKQKELTTERERLVKLLPGLESAMMYGTAVPDQEPELADTTRTELDIVARKLGRDSSRLGRDLIELWREIGDGRDRDRFMREALRAIYHGDSGLLDTLDRMGR